MIQGESVQIISSKNNYEIRLFDMTGNLISSRDEINFSPFSKNHVASQKMPRQDSSHQNVYIRQ